MTRVKFTGEPRSAEETAKREKLVAARKAAEERSRIDARRAAFGEGTAFELGKAPGRHHRERGAGGKHRKR